MTESRRSSGSFPPSGSGTPTEGGRYVDYDSGLVLRNRWADPIRRRGHGDGVSGESSVRPDSGHARDREQLEPAEQSGVFSGDTYGLVDPVNGSPAVRPTIGD